jgi:transcriptional regulator GlxA family with amidase domain
VIDVLFLLLPATLLLDVAGPAEAFRLANQRLERCGGSPAFALRFVSPQTSCTTSVGAQMAALEPLPQSLRVPSWVVLLGQPSGAEARWRGPCREAGPAQGGGLRHRSHQG